MTKKGLGRRWGFSSDGDLALLHGLQQGALDLGRGAVDLVGQDEIGENGTQMRDEPSILRLEDHGADDIAGQKIRGELDALELQAESGAEALDQECLGQTRHAFEKNVAIGQE